MRHRAPCREPYGALSDALRLHDILQQATRSASKLGVGVQMKCFELGVSSKYIRLSPVSRSKRQGIMFVTFICHLQGTPVTRVTFRFHDLAKFSGKTFKNARNGPDRHQLREASDQNFIKVTKNVPMEGEPPARNVPMGRQPII